MSNIREQRILFNKLFNDQEALYRVVAANAGLTEAAYRILYAVCESKETWSQSDICREWNYPKQTVNSSVNKLLKQGLIMLSADVNSKNRKIILLTESGKVFCEKWIHPVIEADIKSLEIFTENELNIIIEILKKQYDSLKENLSSLLEINE